MSIALAQSNRDAFIAGCRDAFGVPVAVLLAGMWALAPSATPVVSRLA